MQLVDESGCGDPADGPHAGCRGRNVPGGCPLIKRWGSGPGPTEMPGVYESANTSLYASKDRYRTVFLMKDMKHTRGLRAS
jgi:hypothetical protein